MIRLTGVLLLFFSSIFTPAWSQSLKYVLSDIHIQGNKRTHSSIILREIPIQARESHTWYEWEELGEMAERQLMNLNLFQHAEVRIEKSHTKKNAVNLVVMLEEKWYLWPIPYFEFADRNFTQWQDFNFDPGRTNYGLYLFWYNVAGRNQTIKISLGTGYTRVNGFEYRSPPAGTFKNWGWSISAYHRSNQEVWYKTENDKLQFLRSETQEMFQRREYQMQVQYRQAALNRHILGIFHHDMRCDSLILQEAYNPNFLGGNERLVRSGFSYRFIHETRDNKYYPLKGRHIDFQASASQLSLGAIMLETFYQSSVHHELKKGWYAAAHHAARARFGSGNTAIPYWLNRNLGYDQFVRGYERYVIDGEFLLMGKLSLKKALFEQANLSNNIPVLSKIKGFHHIPLGLYAGIFMDAALTGSRYPPSGDNQLPGNVLLGGGFGIDINFYTDKVFRLEYSRNKQGEHGLYLNFRQAF